GRASRREVGGVERYEAERSGRQRAECVAIAARQGPHAARQPEEERGERVHPEGGCERERRRGVALAHEKSQREEGEPIARCPALGQTPREAERVGPERGERRARRGKRGGALEAAEARQVERGRGEREQLGVGGQPDPGREQGAERVIGG